MDIQEWGSIYPDRFGELLVLAGWDASFADPAEREPMDILESEMNEFEPIELVLFVRENRN